jgi:hypothetical protein
MAILRLILAVIAGLVIGSVVNMALILAGPAVIAPPAGIDMSTTEGMQAGMHLLQPQHFLFPFLAHALGTLSGALVSYFLAGSYQAQAAYAVGAFFLVGGIVAANLIPAPIWFIIADLALAYLPMAWLARQLGGKLAGG